MNNTENCKRRLMAEWEQQTGILLAWPHAMTDWNYMLPDVQECYDSVIRAITSEEKLLLIVPDKETAQSISNKGYKNTHITTFRTNDTWARDFGAITVCVGGKPTVCDFKFNAWGNKFNWELDNQINAHLAADNLFACTVESHKDFVLEGGSIETDGKGLLLTTSECLLSPERNPQFSKEEIEAHLCQVFGVSKVLWLDYGALEGDDTDSHIDTLARLTPNGGIVYVGCDDCSDSHYEELKRMEQQLQGFTNLDNEHFALFKLPMPRPIYDENQERLPATYANFLVLNNTVLVPTYAQEDNDAAALEVIAQAFPGYSVTGIDCRALIRQHGSLHCITMQFPIHTLNI